MKYVSIDIETTGTDPDKHEIVEIAAKIDDLSNLVSPHALDSFRSIICKEQYVCTPYCSVLHSDLWKEIQLRMPEAKTNSHYDAFNKIVADDSPAMKSSVFDAAVTTANRSVVLLRAWLEAKGVAVKNNKVKINVAGKNYAMFDHNFLKKACLGDWIDVRHRVIDVATHFWRTGDERLPNTELCCQRAGIHYDAQKAHGALYDVDTVIMLVRKALLKNYEI